MHRLQGKSMAKSKSTKELSGGCLSLFGLPFLLAGLFMSGLYFSAYLDWLRAGSWVETPCWIDSAELKVSRDSDSTTYRTLAAYHYEFDGRTYQNDRVGFDKGGDNIGSFQKSVYQELKRHLPSKPKGAERDLDKGTAKPFRCYVNPSKPSEAVLYRTLRWEMLSFMAIFALTFPAVGAGLVAGGIIGGRVAREEKQLQERYPDEPWKWKRIWNTPVVPPRAGPWRTALHLYTIWAGLVIIPLLVSLAASGAYGTSGSAWLTLIYPFLWLIPLWFTVKHLRQRLMIGRAGFEPAEVPAWPGGSLRGAIVLQRPLPPRGVAELGVSCIKSTTRSSGDGTSTSSETLWKHGETVMADAITRDLTGFRIPVDVKLPADVPPCGDGDEPSVKHEWRLSLKVPGTPIDLDFEVPVFRTENSPPPDQTAAASMIEEASIDLPASLAEFRIQADFEDSGAPRSIVCPPARQLGTILFLLVFNLIWTTAAVFLIYQKAPLIFRIVWPVSSAVIWLILVKMLLHKRSVAFSADGMQVVNQLGPVVWTRSVARTQVVGFSHDSNMSSSNATYYRVRAETVIGKKITLADGITSANTAAALAGRMEIWRKENR